jgi:hypothetical protein
MPLSDGYGVAIGTLVSFTRDNPDFYGNHYHGILKIKTLDGEYTCAIDVGTPNTFVGVEYKIISLTPSDLYIISTLSNGYHELFSNATSGAIDYIRSTYLVPKIPNSLRKWMRYFFMGHLISLIEGLMLRRGYGWNSNTGDKMLNALESILNTDNVTKIYVFGEPFSSGDLGVHNIHQHQGNSSGTSWWSENAIWQDGATIIEKSDGTITAFVNKFTSQSYITDGSGHPV